MDNSTRRRLDCFDLLCSTPQDRKTTRICTAMSAEASSATTNPAISASPRELCEDPKVFLDRTLQNAKDNKIRVVVFSKTDCKYCTQAKTIFKNMEIPILECVLDKQGFEASQYLNVRIALNEMTKMQTVPAIYIDGKLLGGCDALIRSFADPLQFEASYPNLIQFKLFRQAVTEGKVAGSQQK